MAAPAFRSAGTIIATTTSNSGITPGAPAGAADGDILILFAFSRADDDPLLPPNISANGTGWTSFATDYEDIGSTGVHLAAWWYRVSGSPPTMPSVQQTTPTDGLRAFICAYSGCITSGTPLEGAGTNIPAGSGGSTSLVGVAVTTTDVDRLVVNMWGENDLRVSAPAAGWTENSEQTTSSPVDSLLVADSIVRATAGTESAPTRTISFSEVYGSIGFALIPSGGGGGGPTPVPNALMMMGCGI